MIERHITFTVREGTGAEFERFFADAYRPPMSESPGFVRVELLREAESDTRYQMVLRWEDADAATGWRTSPVHQALQPDLNALVSATEIQVYVVIG
jgi:heme-degrading monooxygenase HmoA